MILHLSLSRDDVHGADFDRCALAPARRAALLKLLRRDPAIEEAAVVCTCRRTEVFLSTMEVCRARRRARALLRRLTGLGEERLAGALRESRGEAAVQRLLRVAAGLESPVLGEPEVLGQVRAAGAEAARLEATGPVLRALFDTAVRAGRRVRHETRLGRGAVGIPALGAELLAKELAGLEHPRVVLVGAGEMGSGLARRLADQGVDLRITSRTASKARALAEELGACWFAPGGLEGELAQADGLAVAVSDGPLHGLEAWWSAGTRLRAALDLGAPSALPPAVPCLTRCARVDLETIEALARSRHARRAQEVPAAEAIVTQEAARFGRWLRAREGRALADDVMREVERRREEALGRLLGDAPPDERRQADFLTRRLVASVLQHLAENIRSLHPENAHELELVRRLFGLARPLSQGLPEAKERDDVA